MNENNAAEAKSAETLLSELLAYQKKEVRHTRIAMLANVVLVVVLLAAVVTLAPKAAALIGRMQTTLTEIDELARGAGAVAENANTIAASAVELADGAGEMIGNANEMIGNVNEVVTANTDTVTEAVRKINDVDFAKLNEAITNLNNVVRPLSEFFGLFSRD